jgi:hypothetical protein
VFAATISSPVVVSFAASIIANFRALFPIIIRMFAATTIGHCRDHCRGLYHTIVTLLQHIYRDVAATLPLICW